MTFDEHKEITAADCEMIGEMMTDLASQCRNGHMASFERMWIEGGTEEGDSRIAALRELIVLRYLKRSEECQ